jgi:acetyl esterase/lipase
MLLDGLAAAGGPALSEMSPPEAREVYKSLTAFDQPEEVARVDDRVVPGADNDIPVRVYTPAEAIGGAAPLLVWLHGGGWVIGDLDTADATARALANRSGAVVVSVDYRLAPEHTAPAALDDALAALTWAVENGELLGVDATHVAVGGDSAGGNLAAVLCQRVRDEFGPDIDFQLLVYPVVDCTRSHPSIEENAEGYFLTKDAMESSRASGGLRRRSVRGSRAHLRRRALRRHARLLECRHLGKQPARRAKDGQSKCRPGPLTQAQFELQERTEFKPGQDGRMSRLGRAMACDQEGTDRRAERGGDEGRRPGNEAVQNNWDPPGRRPEDDSRESGDLEPAHLGKHIETIRRIRSMQLEGLFNHLHLPLENVLINSGAATGNRSGRTARNRRGDRARGSGVSDSHLPGGDDVGRLDHPDACLDRADGLVVRHRGFPSQIPCSEPHLRRRQPRIGR